MKLYQRGRVLAIWTPAKVNLFLEVLGKRTDGYHELETVMVAVTLYDKLVFMEEPSGAIAFECDDPTLPQGPTNLVVRSAQQLRSLVGNAASRGVRIRLQKRIPAGAGLGGGSSDAAATIFALDRFWQLGWSRERLANLGAQIGSDVPFFFHTPAALGRGRGEILTPLSLPQPLLLVLVCVRESVSTAEVFARLPRVAEPRSSDPVVEGLSRADWATVGNGMFNRLEPTAREICPAIAAAHAVVQHAGLASAMTGSGSAVFGLAESATQARQAARQIRERFPARVFIVRTLPAWPAAKEHNSADHRSAREAHG